MFEDGFGMPLEPWSDEACIGYMIAALEYLKYTPLEIASAVSELKELFDWMAAGDAAEHYENSEHYEW